MDNSVTRMHSAVCGFHCYASATDLEVNSVTDLRLTIEEWYHGNLSRICVGISSCLCFCTVCIKFYNLF